MFKNKCFHTIRNFKNNYASTPTWIVNFFLPYCEFNHYLHFVFSNYVFKIIQIKMTLRGSWSRLNSTTSRIFFLLQRPTDPGDPHSHPCSR